MNTEQREKNQQGFAAKNERRSTGAASVPRRERRYARELRRSVTPASSAREISVPGAFGDATKTDWNDRVVGTTGVAK